MVDPILHTSGIKTTGKQGGVINKKLWYGIFAYST